MRIVYPSGSRDCYTLSCLRCVLAHCHVVGSTQPSYADHEATLACRKMLDRLDIELLDHLIFCDGDYVSLAQTGELHRF